jgi:hypothetical protein
MSYKERYCKESPMRKDFEAWALREQYDITHDPDAPICIYTCWKTDAAYEGWEDYHLGVEYNESPFMDHDREINDWCHGWRGAREYRYVMTRDGK